MAQASDSIRFILNDTEIALSDVAPTDTLLDFLRLQRRLTGTKEGCAEGDCGACTVLVGRLAGDPQGRESLVYETVDACIRFIGSLNATHVVTVEHLAASDGALHPVQQAMVDYHGSQCGFCTPGIVMSLYGLWLTNDNPSRAAIEKALQGNLCRCTGYEPIVRAAEAAAKERPSAIFDPITRTRETVAARLKAFQPTETIVIRNGENCLVLPADTAGLATALAEYPTATIVAGSTDVGLWVTKQMRPISPAVFISGIAELQRIESSGAGLTIGAGVTYSSAFEALSLAFPSFGPLLDRIGGEQVRNMGTIGGNIANGSPIGDSPPPLIALGATVSLRSKDGTRSLPLEDFFIAYGKQDRRPGEFVESIFVPALPAGDRFAAYKVTKRRDEDISALLGAFRIALDCGRVKAARIAFGGMAATPKRPKAVEAALIGQPWTEDTVRAAQAAFETDYQPITDWRASSAYRMLAAKNLLMRFFLESVGEKAQLERFEDVA
ncbi:MULTISPECIES: xanthine dehydrogenase small subunit [Sinorhizobium]|uniref:Xanthine dehydrogenase small subunit n=1 Tax=Sinorhizobium americanum TaxID=194963 RepID=A0A2S3YM91_9HYPH|nr:MULTISPECIES: xanthine dehydrogenase small subunit [Sinorhizobium]PDT42266.1 xanthine dehydrogenase small subunit [Sinorhizobium sp. FG01]POH30183.1 xanthine dehydrogenase small subunit [Sinorhizobium americanum]